jgi:hypothetical protein
MRFVTRQACRAAATGALISVLSVPQAGLAQAADHIVSPGEMQNTAVHAAQQRQQNVETLDRFFSSNEARQALRPSHIDPQQVRSAIPSLNDAELAQLSARANKAQQQFAAGTMNDHDLLLILVVVAILILVIVAVH